MYFKKNQHWIFAAILLANCDLVNLNDPPQKAPETIEMSGNSSACLSRSFKDLENYIDGRVGDKNPLTHLLECTDQALLQFSNTVRGAKNGVYSRRELTAFLNRFFLNQEGPADEKVLNLFFFLKTSFIGGTPNEITKTELSKFRLILSDLKSYSRIMEDKLNRSPLAGSEMNPLHLNLIREELLQLAEQLGQRISTFNTTLSVQRLIQYFQATERLRSYLGQLPPQDLVKLADYFKSSILKIGRNSEVRPKDWQKVLRSIAALSIWTYELSSYLTKIKNPFSDEGTDHVESLAKNLRVLWRDLGSPELNIRKLTELPTTLLDAKKVFGLSAASASELLNFLLNTLQKQGRSGPDLRYFGQNQVDDIAETLKSWAKIQRLTNQALKSINPEFEGTPHEKIGAPSNRFYFNKSDLHKIGNPQAAGVLKELFQSELIVRLKSPKKISRPFSDFFDTLMKFPSTWNRPHTGFRPLVINEPSRGVQFSAAEISVRLLFWMANSRIFDAYGSLPRNSRGLVNHLLKEDFDQLYKDLRSFGIEVRWFDPNSTNAAELRHREADLFMNCSNGNKLMELREAIEIFTTLVSVKVAAEEMHKAFLGMCETSRIADFTLYKQVNSNCLFSNLFSEKLLDYYRASLPSMVNFYEKSSPVDKERFRGSFEKMFRIYKDAFAGYVTTERIGALMLYQEMIMRRFDRNHSQTIDHFELEALFDHLSKTLSTASGSSEKGRNRAILAYLLKHGQMPNNSWIDGAGFYLFFENNSPGWRFSADRNRIMEVFSAVSTRITQKTANESPAPAISKP